MFLTKGSQLYTILASWFPYKKLVLISIKETTIRKPGEQQHHHLLNAKNKKGKNDY